MINIGPFQLGQMDIGPFQSDIPPDISNEITLFINGPLNTNDSLNLFTKGLGSGVVADSDDDFGISIDSLFVSTDYSPQLIGRFDVNPTGATIEVWDVIGGVNAPVSLINNECYPISDTGRWGWSTSNLPPFNSVINQYVYRMTGDNLEVFVGTFIMKNREKVNSKIPRDNSHVRRL